MPIYTFFLTVCLYLFVLYIATFSRFTFVFFTKLE